MALRSTLDIDVNDANWKKFQAQYEKYSEGLAKMPGAWAKVDKGAQKSGDAIAAMIKRHAELLKKLNAENNRFDDQSKRTARTWKDIATSTKTVLGNVKDTTLSLLKWTGIATAFTGLIGGGSLFGLDLLAASAGNTRRSALGRGITYGQQRAFGFNYGRVVDSESYLSNVNAALHDITKRGALYAAGLNEHQLQGNTADVGVALIEQLKRIADRTPAALLGQTYQARGLGQFLSLEDFERLRNTSAKEIAGYGPQFRRDSRLLALSDENARRWQEFDIQLSRAGQKIENVLIRGLEPLAGPLSDLSDQIAEAIDSFAKSGKLKEWMGELGDGIKNLAKYLGSDEFQADLKETAQDVSAVAKALVNALKWLDIIPNHDKSQKQSVLGAVGTLLNPFNYLSPSQNGQAVKTVRDWMTGADDAAQGGSVGAGGRGAAHPATAAAMGAVQRAAGRWGGALTEASVQAWLKTTFPGLVITGGTRDEFTNRMVGGVRNSMHLTGEAADLKLPKNVSFAEFKRVLKAMGFPVTELLNEGRIGNQGAHIHLGWRGARPANGGHKTEVVIRDTTGGNVQVSSQQIAG